MNDRIKAKDASDGIYTKKPGDLEVRILKDGKIVFVAPDQEMLDVSEKLKDVSVAPQTDDK